MNIRPLAKGKGVVESNKPKPSQAKCSALLVSANGCTSTVTMRMRDMVFDVGEFNFNPLCFHLMLTLGKLCCTTRPRLYGTSVMEGPTILGALDLPKVVVPGKKAGGPVNRCQ